MHDPDRTARPAAPHAKAALFALVVLAALSSSACSRLAGYGLVLWTVDEPRIDSGSSVPIYFKSNIQKAYIVGVPGTKDKAEVPLWKVEVFKSRKAAEKAAADFAATASMYAVCLRDGLVIRKEPHNRAAATQVYRLQLGEVVKLLRVVEGEPVMTGGKALAGDWWLALAADGTRGYVFSNQLRVFDEKVEPRPSLASGSTAVDEKKVARLFSAVWRPESFDEMVSSGLIDLDRFQARFGFFVDATGSSVRLETSARSFSATYSGISTSGNEVSFDGTPLRVRFEGDRKIVAVLSSDADKVEESFVDFDGDVLAIVRNEEARRTAAYADFVAAGGRLSGDAAGVLTFLPGGRFTWGAYERLVGEWLDEYAGDGGAASLGVLVDPAVPGGWEGGFTLAFDGGSGARPATVRVAYRTGPGWVELAPVAAAELDGGTLIAAPAAEPIRFSRSRP